MELYVMTTRELRRLEVLQRLRAGEITQRQAAVRLGLCIRQIKRLWRAYQ
jgi:Trp operon repressor